MKRIHLDWAAGAPLLADASRAMEPWLEDRPANASSLHADGRQARAAIDEAREACAEAAGCLFGEFLFTSGGTESDNAAILGAALAAPDSRRRILLGAAEHHAVLHTRPMLERLGFRVDLVPVDRRGSPRIADLADLLAELAHVPQLPIPV
ncbi:MAG: aminotransferase class V-fold PLP-dependent enzyme, partial [Fimbriimonadaceae bacterium]|nr:aminotransferase class V-fold PLP-dependent enzyme [Fimbriimonadaceae bacterium]